MKKASGSHCHIRLSETMDHNDYDMMDDILGPISRFLHKCNLTIKNSGHQYKFPSEVKKKPECLKNKENKRSIVSLMMEKIFG